MRRVFRGLRTVTEIQNMAQRPEVAQLPADGRNYQEITNGAGVSAATISRVNRSLQYGTGGYEIVFGRLKEQAEKAPQGYRLALARLGREKR